MKDEEGDDAAKAVIMRIHELVGSGAELGVGGAAFACG